MIRLQAGYYQDLFLGEIYAVAKHGSHWECQHERNGKWLSGFKSKAKAAAYARFIIATRQREAKEARK